MMGETHSWLEEYELGMKTRIEPEQFSHEQEEERIAIGWDVTITPDHTPCIIEYHTDGFGTNGFRPAGTNGSIDFSEYAEPREEFYTFLSDHSQKDKSHDVIDHLMPDLLEDEEDLATYDGDTVVTKPVEGGGGRGVTFVDPDSIDMDEYEDKVVEGYVESKGVPVTTGPARRTRETLVGSYPREVMQGFALAVGSGFAFPTTDIELVATGTVLGVGMFWDGVLRSTQHSPVQRAERTIDESLEKYGYAETQEHNACMRYVTGIDVDEDGITVEDFGGYWRTAKRPKDADTSKKSRYLANLHAGKPVTPTEDELATAYRAIINATATMYQHWLAENQSFCPECKSIPALTDHATNLNDLQEELNGEYTDTIQELRTTLNTSTLYPPEEHTNHPSLTIEPA